MIVDLTSTITGQEVDGWWIFTGIMAERVAKVTGLQLVKSFGGVVKTGFAVRNECLYTPKLVKAGYKISITL